MYRVRNQNRERYPDLLNRDIKYRSGEFSEMTYQIAK